MRVHPAGIGLRDARPAAGERARAALRRLFVNGPLALPPKLGPELEMLLAMAHSQFEPGVRYEEPEVNRRLRRWLATFCAEDGVDHVTCRRYLVDLRFLARDAAGSSYRFDAARARAVLGEDGMSLHPAQVLGEVRDQRAARKRAQAGGRG